MDIIMLSRNISTYLTQDLSYLNSDGTEDSNIYFTGDIIQQSTNLAPEIINAERERYSDKKHKHLESLDLLTFRLYNNCKRLEHSSSNGKGTYCTEITFLYLKKKGNFYLVFTKPETKITLGKERKWVNPWIDKKNICN